MGRTKGGEKDYSFGNNVIYVFIINIHLLQTRFLSF